jgi:heat induced stress protein YflT
MSNLGLGGAGQLRIPTPPRGDTIARYATYLEAQRAVDYLSDQAFPVQFVTIVGTGLRMVERVTGRLTYPKVAGASALSGAWLGLFFGLVLSLFGNGSNGILLPAILFGAGFGILWGIITYSLTGGRRDFTSQSQVVASEYEVLCLPEQAGRARELLGRLQAEGQVHSLGNGPGSGSNPYAPPPQGSPPYGSAPYGPGQPGPTPGQQGSPPQPPPYQPASNQPPPNQPPSPYGEPPGPSSAEPAPPVTGPTYGEMIERQRREREEAERRRRVQEAGERAGQQAPPPPEPPPPEPTQQLPTDRDETRRDV